MLRLTASLLLLCVTFVLARISAPCDDGIISSPDSETRKNILVSFKNNDIERIRSGIQARKFLSRSHKIQSLYSSLKEHSDLTQAQTLRFLEKHKSLGLIELHQLWISNQLIIKNADLSLIKQLSEREEVAAVVEDKTFKLEPLLEVKEMRRESSEPLVGETWGVVAVDATKAWELGFRGQGVVVADVDSGVRATHEALRDGYREENGWYDPAGNSPIPVDAVGHGTHTTGSIAGRGGIGVAPEAKWIACRGCGDDGVCSLNAFMRCGQWVLCPTDPFGNNPRCDLAPNIVSNSWGTEGGATYFDSVLRAWELADIAPIFSAGNAGDQGCSTHLSPADSPLAISVGATDPSSTITYFSSLGPASHTGAVKPEISAPGWDILSASNTGDNVYASASGTSMSCPHVAGLAALLYSRKLDLTPKQFREILMNGAQPVVSGGNSCGGVRDDVYPNNHAGFGKVSATASLDEIDRKFKK